MRRKGWANLNPAYRARLERSGITQSKYDSGANLQVARGQRAERRHSQQARREGRPSDSTLRSWYRDTAKFTHGRERGVDSTLTRAEFDLTVAERGYDWVRDRVLAWRRAERMDFNHKADYMRTQYVVWHQIEDDERWFWYHPTG